MSDDDDDITIRPSLCPSVCPMSQLSYAVGTLAAGSLAMCGLRTRPRTDVDPSRVELPTARGISSRRPPGAITCFIAVCLFVCWSVWLSEKLCKKLCNILELELR